MKTTCEQLSADVLCIPLNAFNTGSSRGTVRCQAIGCEETCPIRPIMTQHQQELAKLRAATCGDTLEYNLDKHGELITSVGTQFEALPMLAGVRALGARFV